MVNLVHLEPSPSSGAQLDVVHALVVNQVDLLPPVDLRLLDVSRPGKLNKYKKIFQNLKVWFVEEIDNAMS